MGDTTLFTDYVRVTVTERDELQAVLDDAKIAAEQLRERVKLRWTIIVGLTIFAGLQAAQLLVFLHAPPYVILR